MGTSSKSIAVIGGGITGLTAAWQLHRAGHRVRLFEKAAQTGGSIVSLAQDGWLIEGHFTAADSYALTFFRWGRRIGMDMSRYPAWSGLNKQVLERPAVKAALDREGLKAEEFLPELVLNEPQ